MRPCWPLRRVATIFWIPLVLACLLTSSTAAAEDNERISIQITGKVLTAAGAPAADATVHASLPLGKLDARAKTNDDGTFELPIKVHRIALSSITMRTSSSDGEQLAIERLKTENDEVRTEDLVIQLSETTTAAVRVIDGDGKPVSNAAVAAQLNFPNTITGLTTDDSGSVTFRFPKMDRIESIVAWKDHEGLDYRVYALPRHQRSDTLTETPEFPIDRGETLRLEGTKPLQVRITDDSGKPIPSIRNYVWLLKKEDQPDQLNLSYFVEAFSESTDNNGELAFDWIPSWHTTLLQIWPSSDDFVRTRGNYDPATGDGVLEMQLDRLVPIGGKVTDADGPPVPDIRVSARGDGYTMDDSYGTATTDADGNYEIRVAPEQIYLVTVKDPRWASTPQTGFAVRANTPVTNKNFVLREATRVFGRLTDESTGEPIPNKRVIVYQYGTDLNSIEGVELRNPDNSRKWVRPMDYHHAITDEGGQFAFALGDGHYDIRPPEQEKADEFDIAGQSELEINVSTVLRTEVKLTGKVTAAADGEAVASAMLAGVPQNFRGRDWQARTGTDGTFSVMRYKEPTYVHVENQDKTLAAVVIVAPEQTTLNVSLHATASVTGRLLANETKEPLPNQKITYGIDVPSDTGRSWSTRFGGSVVTDDEGQFSIDGLVGGQKYSVNLGVTEEGLYRSLPKWEVESGETLSLGDVQVPPPPKRYVPPTLEERIAAAFAVKGTPIERYERALKPIKLVKQHLLVVFGQSEDSRIHRLMQIRYEDKDFRQVRDEYLFLAIPTEDDKRKPAMALAEELDESIEGERGDFLLVILDHEGKKVATVDSAAVCDGDELSKEMLLKVLGNYYVEKHDANELLGQALAKAAKENKCVIVQETATWCGPCHRLSGFLAENREWEEDFILVKMDHRWEGAYELMKEMREGAKGGIPWFAILDASGKKLATSNDEKTGDNIGFPSSKQGQAHFAFMLNQTRQRLSEEDVANFVSKLSPPDEDE
ncbi:thioredoxin H-type [Rhodopirellula maiorica SM1]|uniref:Thioredoxin H-type n=1 Tax=Rhodopirellula maiorica SM1 TaxID=1265738 RepID=M5R9K7_9BACT|nr:carboxypeptidase regulatory-like domain-containing protein [Rhodopirellula maiorica]EMI16178.1 thioredoxin H-type [Rhodopirellula maiorica SM1]